MRPYMLCDNCECQWEEDESEDCCPECGSEDYEVIEE